VTVSSSSFTIKVLVCKAVLSDAAWKAYSAQPVDLTSREKRKVVLQPGAVRRWAAAFGIEKWLIDAWLPKQSTSTRDEGDILCIGRFETAGRKAVCQVSGQGEDTALLLQDFPPPEGEKHRWPAIFIEEATLCRSGLKLIQEKIAALPAAWHAGILRGAESFGIRVEADNEFDAAVRLLGQEAAETRRAEAAMTAWYILGVPVEYTREDVAAFLLLHQAWEVKVKKPKRMGPRIHRWRLLSATVPNLDFVQLGMTLNCASFPQGEAPISIVKEEALPKPPPREDRGKVMVWKPAESQKKTIHWPKPMAGGAAEDIKVQPAAETVTGGVVRSFASVAAAAGVSGASGTTGPTPMVVSGGGAGAVASSSSSASSAAGGLFTSEQLSLMKTSGEALRADIGNTLREEMKSSLSNFMTELSNKLDQRLGEVHKKIEDVASEKKARSGSGTGH
jgi:hypothetical protein